MILHRGTHPKQLAFSAALGFLIGVYSINSLATILFGVILTILGSRETLTVQALGTQTRSFCSVSDMVDGLYRLMNGEHTGPINLGNPKCGPHPPPGKIGAKYIIKEDGQRLDLRFLKKISGRHFELG